MAGHSKWANIKHRKGAQDKKRGNLFTKLGKELTVAAKSGDNPDFNPALRLAISNAKSNSMPKDKIETAISRASGLSGDNYETITYEGFAGGGVALIVDCLTDNKNRSVSEVRTCLSKNGGNLGENGTVSFMFEHVGFIQYPADKAAEDEMFEHAIEAGASDCFSDKEFHTVICAKEDFASVRDALTEKLGDAETGRLIYQAKDPLEIAEEASEKLESLIEKLEDLDDVQYVYSNAA